VLAVSAALSAGLAKFGSPAYWSSTPFQFEPSGMALRTRGACAMAASRSGAGPGPTAMAMPRGSAAAARMRSQSIASACSATRFHKVVAGFLVFWRSDFGTSDQSRLSSTSGS
jgi:hypothetical protein